MNEGEVRLAFFFLLELVLLVPNYLIIYGNDGGKFD
jgi:hypothetical protein